MAENKPTSWWPLLHSHTLIEWFVKCQPLIEINLQLEVMKPNSFSCFMRIAQPLLTLRKPFPIHERNQHLISLVSLRSIDHILVDWEAKREALKKEPLNFSQLIEKVESHRSARARAQMAINQPLKCEKRNWSVIFFSVRTIWHAKDSTEISFSNSSWHIDWCSVIEIHANPPVPLASDGMKRRNSTCFYRFSEISEGNISRSNRLNKELNKRATTERMSGGEKWKSERLIQ